MCISKGRTENWSNEKCKVLETRDTTSFANCYKRLEQSWHMIVTHWIHSLDECINKIGKTWGYLCINEETRPSVDVGFWQGRTGLELAGRRQGSETEHGACTLKVRTLLSQTGVQTVSNTKRTSGSPTMNLSGVACVCAQLLQSCLEWTLL